MEKLFQTIGMSLLSSKDFQKKDIVERFLHIVNSYGETFIPDVYGFLEPLKFIYNSFDISGPSSIYMHEEVNKKLAVHGQAAGSLMMQKKRGEVFYHIEWTKKTVKQRFNYFSFSSSIDTLKENSNYKDFVSMCNEFVYLLEPVYGKISNSSFPNWSNPFDLEIRLPEIQWMNYYGKPYLEMFGEEKLLNTPCDSAEKIGDDIVAIQTTGNLLEEIPDDVRNKIKMHLGEDAFMWGNKRSLAYKDGKVPNFDYSGVTFEKNKTIYVE